MNLPFGTAEHPITINLHALVKWLMNKIKRRTMCFKKIAEWFKPEPIIEPVGEVEYLALLFGINDYQGAGNDLRGCINDVDDVEFKLKREFPHFTIRKFTDSQVTTTLMIREIEDALLKVKKVLYIHYSGHGTKIGSQEALYLYNGPLMDDVFCDLQNKTPDYLHVIAKFDSCYSGGMDDRRGNPRYIKSRYYPILGMKTTKAVTTHMKGGDSQKWVIFSGCGENQTSADAFFGGRANGAFTFNDLRAYTKFFNYTKEHNKLRTYLPDEYFDQIPELTGNESLFNTPVLT